MQFRKWFDTFVSEKGVDPEKMITVSGPSGPNVMPLGVVFEAIKGAPAGEQAKIKTMLVKIDFANGNVVDFFKHLAKAIAR